MNFQFKQDKNDELAREHGHLFQPKIVLFRKGALSLFHHRLLSVVGSASVSKLLYIEKYEGREFNPHLNHIFCYLKGLIYDYVSFDGLVKLISF